MCSACRGASEARWPAVPAGQPVRRERAGPIGPRLQFEVGPRQMIYVESDLKPGEDERLRLLAFSTPDLEALAAHLTAKGIAVTRVLAPGPGPGPAIAVSPTRTGIRSRSSSVTGRRRTGSQRPVPSRGQAAALDAHPARRPDRPRRGGGQPVLQGHPGVQRDLAGRPVGGDDRLDQHAGAGRHRLSGIHAGVVTTGSAATRGASPRGAPGAGHPGGVGSGRRADAGGEAGQRWAHRTWAATAAGS